MHSMTVQHALTDRYLQQIAVCHQNDAKSIEKYAKRYYDNTRTYGERDWLLN